MPQAYGHTVSQKDDAAIDRAEERYIRARREYLEAQRELNRIQEAVQEKYGKTAA